MSVLSSFWLLNMLNDFNSLRSIAILESAERVHMGNLESSLRAYPEHFKGIFQPFELGGETILIRSAVKH